MTQVKGRLLRPHSAPHSCPLPTVFLMTPHLIRRCHARRTYKRGPGGDGCDREVLVGGGNGLAQVRASVGWGASEEEVCGQPGL